MELFDGLFWRMIARFQKTLGKEIANCIKWHVKPNATQKLHHLLTK